MRARWRWPRRCDWRKSAARQVCPSWRRRGQIWRCTPKISPRNEMAVPTHCRIPSIGNDPRTENSARASSKFRNSVNCPVAAIRPIKPTSNGILSSSVLKERSLMRASRNGVFAAGNQMQAAGLVGTSRLCGQCEQMSPFSINQISTRAISGLSPSPHQASFASILPATVLARCPAAFARQNRNRTWMSYRLSL